MTDADSDGNRLSCVDSNGNVRNRREAVIEQTQTLIGAPPNSTPSTSPLVRVGFGSRAPVVARLMGRPVCPQLRNCRVRPSSYAWCQNRKSDPWQDAGFARVGAPGTGHDQRQQAEVAMGW